MQVGHINAGRRWIRNWKQAILDGNRLIVDHKPTRDDKHAYRDAMNSYLGLMTHYNTYRLRYTYLRSMHPLWLKHYTPNIKLKKLVKSC